MLIADGFIIIKLWKQTKCHSIGKWCGQRMEYYHWAIKEMSDEAMKLYEGTLMHINKWIGQIKKALLVIISIIWLFGKGKIIWSKRITGCHGLEEGEE